MKYIENEAFKHCESLSVVIIPVNVRYIGRYAFSDCYSIITVMFENVYISVEDTAFSDSGTQCFYDPSEDMWVGDMPNSSSQSSSFPIPLII